MCTKTKEETKGTKSRKTRLGKKSVNELIDIILRKDDVEKNYKEKVANQKTYIGDLECSNAGLKKENEKIEQDRRNLANNVAGLERRLNEVTNECNYLDSCILRFKLLTGILALTSVVLMLVLIL